MIEFIIEFVKKRGEKNVRINKMTEKIYTLNKKLKI